MTEKKSFWTTLVNAFTDRDEKAAAQKALEVKAAAEISAIEKETAAKMAAARAAANKAALEKAAAYKASTMKEIAARQAAAKAALEEASKPKTGTVIVRSLRVRKDHSVDSPVVEGLAKGDKISISNIWVDGNNMWAQLGPDKWSAIKYNNEELIDLD